MSFNASGWACDANVAGGTGVSNVLVKEGATTYFTLPQNSDRQGVIDAGLCQVLRSGFNYNLSTLGWSLGSHALTFTAQDGAGGCTGDWDIENASTPITVTITNSIPQNVSFSPNSGDIFIDLGGPEVSFTATFRDSNPVPSGRYHDVEEGKVKFGTSVDNYILEVVYDDDGSDVCTTGNGDSDCSIGITDGSESGNITLVPGSTSRSTSGNDLIVVFTLDFSGLSQSAAGTYNIYMYTEDWVGAEDDWQIMGALDIWNGSDVSVSGLVYDVTPWYPLATCANFASAGTLAGVEITLDGGVAGTQIATTNGSGEYSTTLTYGASYGYSLDGASYFNDLADLSEIQPGMGCEPGVTGLFTVTASGVPGPGLDFGMSEIKSPWIQVVATSLTSYSSISIDIPATCVTDYDNGGDCLPFISINDTSLGLEDNGVVAARGAISIGDGSGVGNPEDWQVVDSNLWRETGKGFAYYENLLEDELDPDDIITGDTNLSDISGLDDCLVGNDEAEVKLIDGSLAVDCLDFSVSETNGLAFIIVSGNIIVNGDVSHLEGIFTADGNIQINNEGDGEGDQITLEGTYIADADGNGAGGVVNNRSLEATTGAPGDLTNNLSPAAVFQYRPDLLIALLRFDETIGVFELSLDWEEINP